MFFDHIFFEIKSFKNIVRVLFYLKNCPINIVVTYKSSKYQGAQLNIHIKVCASLQFIDFSILTSLKIIIYDSVLIKLACY